MKLTYNEMLMCCKNFLKIDSFYYIFRENIRIASCFLQLLFHKKHQQKVAVEQKP